MKIVIETTRKAMSNLVLFRGTMRDITKKINSIGLVNDSVLEPFEEPIKDNDFGFNIHLGSINGTYLDYEVYLLPTNADNEFLVTEVNPF